MRIGSQLAMPRAAWPDGPKLILRPQPGWMARARIASCEALVPMSKLTGDHTLHRPLRARSWVRKLIS